MTEITKRCGWVPEDDPLYQAYHDEEWGRPERDPRKLYELLMLEGFQAGLSWRTILHRREGFRSAFAGFAPEKVAAFTQSDVERLLQDPGIIRHRGKIEATIAGAQSWLKLEEQHPGGFSAFIWETLEGKPQVNRWTSLGQVPAQTPASQGLSKRLKAEGFKFCGPTIVYAFMQAAGLIDDHEESCFRAS